MIEHDSSARILAIALRSPQRGPMREVPSAVAVPDKGLEGDGHVSPERGITLLSRERWADATAELGVELPWQTRRANLLVQGIDLAAAIGGTLRLGEAVLRIEGETDPCMVMDRAHYGLKAALTPNCRGGVHGRVIQGGRIAVGDDVVLIT
ncbi:MAG: MOSC domain-containing protein [Pirellulales bacterium]